MAAYHIIASGLSAARMYAMKHKLRDGHWQYVETQFDLRKAENRTVLVIDHDVNGLMHFNQMQGWLFEHAKRQAEQGVFKLKVIGMDDSPEPVIEKPEPALKPEELEWLEILKNGERRMTVSMVKNNKALQSLLRKDLIDIDSPSVRVFLKHKGEKDES